MGNHYVAINRVLGFLQTGSPDGAKTNLLQPAACNPVETYGPVQVCGNQVAGIYL
jgi:hypothetical protein